VVYSPYGVRFEGTELRLVRNAQSLMDRELLTEENIGSC
jgi:hypothetical protein